MAAQGCQRAIDLLGEHGAGQLVRHGQGRQGKERVSARLPSGGETFGPADHENQVAALAPGFLDEESEGRRIERAAGWIEQDLRSRRVLSPGVEPGGTYF